MPTAVLGPFEKNMFGKPSAHTPRYVFGSGDHLSLSSTPSRPTMGKGKRYDVSKPVAQMMMSRSMCFPSSVSMPVGVTCLMCEVTRSYCRSRERRALNALFSVTHVVLTDSIQESRGRCQSPSADTVVRDDCNEK